MSHRCCVSLFAAVRSGSGTPSGRRPPPAERQAASLDLSLASLGSAPPTSVFFSARLALILSHYMAVQLACPDESKLARLLAAGEKLAG